MAIFTTKAERWLTGIMAVVLVVMLAVLAWQFGQKFGYRLGRPQPVETPPNESVAMVGPPQEQLAAIIASPLAGSDWEPVAEDPAGITPPASARRWQCARLVNDGYQHHNGYYNAPGPIEPVRQAFLAELERVGFERQATGEETPYIILARGLEYVTLSLRNRDEDATIVEVVLTHAKAVE